jgi:tetratricopeptide (TPR) repeat protein
LLRGAPCQSFTVHATQALEGVVGAIPHPKKASVWLERSLERLGRGEPQEIAALNQTLAALLTANAPVILHVEDLHEVGLERLEFWRRLALAVTRTRRVGLIVTSRAQPPEEFEVIRLAALTREASDALLETEAGTTLPREALAWLFEHAAGNPLYTLEFFRFLARQGFLWNDGQRWRWRTPERAVMPVTVEALIEQLLREAITTPALEDALHAKAVLGLEASDKLWAEVAGLAADDLSVAKRELEGQGVLSGGEFAHPLYREVTIHNLASVQRQSFARRALEVFKDDPKVAAGFLVDAELEPGAALEWLRGFIENARMLGDETRVAELLEQSVQYVPWHEKAKLASEAARTYMSRDLPAAIRMAELALQHDPTNPVFVFLMAEVHARRLDLSSAETILERLSLEDRRSPDFLIRLIELKSFARQYASGLEIWDEHRDALSVTLSPQSHYRIAYCMVMRDREPEALELVSKALDDHAGYKPHERADLLGIVAMCHSRSGAVEKAAQIFSQVILEYEKDGQPRRIGASYFNLAITLGQLGRFKEQLTALQHSTKNYEIYGDLYFIYRAKMTMANTLIYLGQYELAEDLLLESRAFINDQDFSTLTTYFNFLSNLYSGWSMPQSGILFRKYALAATETARRYGNNGHLVPSLANLINAEIELGNLEAADRLSLENLDVASTEENPEMSVNALRSRSRSLEASGRLTEATAMLEQAEQIARSSELYLETHLTGLKLAHLKHDLPKARAHHDWFEQRGLLRWVNEAHRYFPELVTDGTLQGSKRPAPAVLTNLEVLGPMQIRHDGITVPLRGGKRKQLLGLLLEARIRGRSEVTGLDLCDALYPLEPEEVALGALKATVFKIRSSLRPELIATTPNGYALGPVASDAEAFLQTGDTRLWRGPYLEDAALEGRDENVRDALYHALETSARALLEGDPADPQEAARLGRLLVLAEPYDLGVLDLACRALRASQNRKGLSRLYEDARTRMLEVGEVLPERSEAFLEAQPA